MNFDWAEFLLLAKELGNRPDACAKRTALSRAYYAVFHKATDFVEQKLGIQVKEEAGFLKQSMHQYVWNQIEDREPDLAEEGRILLRNRIQADYHDRVRKLETLCALSIVRAHKALERIQELPGP